MTSRAIIINWGMILVGVLTNVLGVWAVKARMSALGSIHLGSIGEIWSYFISLARSPSAFIGAILIMIAPIPYAIALSRMALSIAYPVSIALSFLAMLPISIVFFKEPLSISKLAGISLILVSLYLLHR